MESLRLSTYTKSDELLELATKLGLSQKEHQSVVDDILPYIQPTIDKYNKLKELGVPLN